MSALDDERESPGAVVVVGAAPGAVVVVGAPVVVVVVGAASSS